jgi:hypothetical protein
MGAAEYEVDRLFASLVPGGILWHVRLKGGGTTIAKTGRGFTLEQAIANAMGGTGAQRTLISSSSREDG